jgi:hypothetical protein
MAAERTLPQNCSTPISPTIAAAICADRQPHSRPAAPYRAAFPDVRFTVRGLVVDSNRAAVRTELTFN